EGRLARYTWHDAYAELRERLDALGRALGGAYRVLVDANQHVDREAAARSGVGFYGKNTMLITRRHGSWVVLGTLVTDMELDPTTMPATSTSSIGSSRTAARSSTSTTGSTCRRTILAGCAATRWSPSATSAAPSTSPCCSATPRTTTTRAGRSRRSRSAREI